MNVLGSLVFGTGVGILSGLLIGSKILQKFDQKNNKEIETLENEESKTDQIHELITKDPGQVYGLLPMWTKYPDYEQVRWINTMFAKLWPELQKALNEKLLVIIQIKLVKILKQKPWIKAVDIKRLNVGDVPFNFGGIKTYESNDYELIFESMLMWGSTLEVDLDLKVKLGPFKFQIPVEIRDFQLIARSRVYVRPLVEKFPCLGAISIQLLDLPYFDFVSNIVSKVDLMSLPGVNSIVRLVVGKIINRMMVYPNSKSFELMTNSGLPVPPEGMLQVQVNELKKLNGNQKYTVNLEVRDGISTQCDYGVQDFEEAYTSLVVDSIDRQNLKIRITEYGYWQPVQIAEGVLCLNQGPNETAPDFISNTNSIQNLDIDLFEPGTLNYAKASDIMSNGVGNQPKQQSTQVGLGFGKGTARVATLPINIIKKKKKELEIEQNMIAIVKQAKADGKAIGAANVSVQWIPFAKILDRSLYHKPQKQDPDAKQPPKNMQTIFHRSVASITNEYKGVLTVQLQKGKYLVNANGYCDPYVLFELEDPNKSIVERNYRQQSSVKLNDSEPVWNEKFEFVMVSATSILYIQVFDQKGLQEALQQGNFMALVPGTKRVDDPIGVLKIAIADVVRNGRIRNVYELLEVEQGELSLILEWQNLRGY